MNTADYVKEVTVTDPDTKLNVGMCVFKHNQSGAMFAIDSSYLNTFDDDSDPIIADVFNTGRYLKLLGL